MNIDIDTIHQYILENILIEAKKVNKGNVIASVKITIPNVLTIKGFTYKNSQFEHIRLGKNVWIEPPSIKTIDGKTMKLVFFEDKDLWNEVEEKIDYEVSNLIDN